MNAKVLGKNGEQIYPECGSYGIGISRLVAAIIESSHDEKGIIWPSSVSPFTISLINLKPSDEASTKLADEVYERLLALNIEVLYDDKDDSIGAKFATHDLLGFPFQVIVGPKSAALNLVELKTRKTGLKEELSIESLFTNLVQNVY